MAGTLNPEYFLVKFIEYDDYLYFECYLRQYNLERDIHEVLTREDCKVDGEFKMVSFNISKKSIQPTFIERETIKPEGDNKGTYERFQIIFETYTNSYNIKTLSYADEKSLDVNSNIGNIHDLNNFLKRFAENY